MKKVYPERSRRGFTLVEVLVSVFILSIVGIAISYAYVGAIKSVDYTKTIIAATALSNEKMEIIHNMPYDNLATLHGTVLPLPANPIPDDEVITRSGITFNVHTVISYYDDPSDGKVTGTAPIDIYPYDYKKIEITIGRNGMSNHLATISTSISGKAAETPSNTGILNICAIDSANKPVPEANVKITNYSVAPAVDMNTTTDSVTGCVMIPKLPPDTHNHYHLEVTKLGFSTDLTQPLTPQHPTSPQPDANVLLQQVTSQTFKIDYLSQMNFQFIDQNGVSIPNVNFTLEGTKITYNNPSVLKYSKNFTAGADGKIQISNLEFDDYKIVGLGSYFLISSIPSNPIRLAAKTDLTVNAVLSTSATNPVISDIAPTVGNVGESVSITINGNNFQPGATCDLYMTPNGGTKITITGTNVNVQNTKKITVDMNLASVLPGLWSLEVINPNGEKVILINGFEIKI